MAGAEVKGRKTADLWVINVARSTGASEALKPSKVMKSAFCSATTLPWKHRPPLCHLDRSEAQWRDLRFAVLSWGCFRQSAAQWRDLFSSESLHRCL